MNTKARTRTWTCLSYLPAEDIRATLTDLHMTAAYCTHDKDNKPPHTHIIVQYSSVKSLEQVRKDLQNIAANGYVEPVKDTKGAVRYLKHLDNPEKYQYDEITTINGWDISKYLETEPAAKKAVKYMKKIIEFIKLNDISYYNELIDLLEIEHRDDLYELAINKRLITPILAYLKAKGTLERYGN